ncbi:hypothetical protein H0A71_06120 [Alcaligenaceae bacterium]|nr:hypothetical protein [Alcaligenaceae bacterium]
MSIDPLFERTYDRDSYNCLHLAAEAWTLLTGDDTLIGVDERDFKRGLLRDVFRAYRRVEGPTVTPSIVLMENLRDEAHIGICYRQRLLHIREHDGVQNLPFDASLTTLRNFRFYQR